MSSDLKTEKVLCAKDACKFKPCNENKYCMKHQICIFLDDTASANKKVCCNYIRGCKNQLEMEYKYSRCTKCLEKDRARDKERRDNAKLLYETKQDGTHQVCTACCKELPKELFIGAKQQITKTCQGCREDNKIQDKRRDKEHRNAIARKNDQKTERKEVKNTWNENNYDKVALKTMNYRQRQIEEDQEAFLKRNAENAKNWRTNNPEKVAENNANKKTNLNLQYNVYYRSAMDKNLDFTISKEEFEKIIVEPCDYCGIIQEKGFNGIDRKDQTIGYISENCVSCCTICNFMKGSLSNDTFMKRVEHILTYTQQIDGKLYPECFGNHHSCSYTIYQGRALKKQIDFVITEEEYMTIIESDCYMCGKKNSVDHCNGIDRFDNIIGYTLENCRPCCGECNYMKKKYKYSIVLDQLKLIYDKYSITKPINDVSVRDTKISNMIIVKGNKKTKEEKNKQAKIRNQRHRELQRQKYGDEEYKKTKSEYIAKYRKEKKKKESENTK